MTRVTNISREMVLKIPIDAPIISIGDRYSQFTDIPNHENRPVLRVNFFTGDHASPDMAEHTLNEEHAEKILAFVKENLDKEVIYVQCGEGRIRSYTVCDALSYAFIEEGVIHDHELATIKTGIIDRHTAHGLIKVARRHEE